MNKLALPCLIYFLMLCFSFLCISAASAEEQVNFGLGGIVNTPLPEWIKPSPLMNLELDSDELDESCDNSAGLPPVGNQSQQNSCSGWGTGYYYLTFLQGQEFGWDLTDPAHQMSPAFVYNTINGGQDAGATPYDGFEVFELMGCGTMADMPYNVSDCLSLPSEETFRNAMNFRIDETFTLNIYNQAGRNALKQHLLDGNIAVIHIEVYQNFYDIEDFDNNYCVNDIYGQRLGGHVVTVVGFDDEYETVDGTGAFRMVNSWGENWGDAGFWWLSYQAAASSTANSGFAIYATDRIGYEPTMTARIELEHGDRYQVIHSVGIGNALDPNHYINFCDWGYERAANIAYPDDAVMLFDVSDLYEHINIEESNDLFYSATDYRGNSIGGLIEDVIISDLDADYHAQSQDTPVTIPDLSIPGWADVTFRYDVIPPLVLDIDLDMSNGNVQIEWDAIEEAQDFVCYAIFRNNEEIATSVNPEYEETLTEFGEYYYFVKSRFADTQSIASPVAAVNWIQPVEPRFLNIQTVDGESGDFVFAWEQLRDQTIIHDDGTYESSFAPAGNADPGAMVSRRMTAPLRGKIVKIGAFFCEGDNMENAAVRLLLHEDNNNLPGDLFFESPILSPDSEGWWWETLNLNRYEVDPNETFWATIKWESLEGSYIGRDMDGEVVEGWAISMNGQDWTYMNGGGNPMIRSEIGILEVVGGAEGLNGYQVFMDDQLIMESEDNYNTINGNFPSPGSYEFRVDALYNQGIFASEPWTFYWNGDDVNVDGEIERPVEWKICNPYPNPFNPLTTLNIQLPVSAEVRSVVFNMLGQQVAELVNGKLGKGNHNLIFDAANFSSGIYLIQTNIAGQLHQVNKVILIK